MVNQNVQEALKKFWETKYNEHDITQKKIKEFREDFKNIEVNKAHYRKRDI
jgi:hypothetical protein